MFPNNKNLDANNSRSGDCECCGIDLSSDPKTRCIKPNFTFCPKSGYLTCNACGQAYKHGQSSKIEIEGVQQWLKERFTKVNQVGRSIESSRMAQDFRVDISQYQLSSHEGYLAGARTSTTQPSFSKPNASAALCLACHYEQQIPMPATSAVHICPQRQGQIAGSGLHPSGSGLSLQSDAGTRAPGTSGIKRYQVEEFHFFCNDDEMLPKTKFSRIPVEKSQAARNPSIPSLVATAPQTLHCRFCKQRSRLKWLSNSGGNNGRATYRCLTCGNCIEGGRVECDRPEQHASSFRLAQEGDIFYCPQCANVANSSSELSSHVRRSTRLGSNAFKPLSEPRASVGSSRFLALCQTVSSYGGEKCGICNKFLLPGALCKKTNTCYHMRHAVYSMCMECAKACIRCGKYLPENGHVRRHVIVKFLNPEVIMLCISCGYSFDRMLVHSTQSELEFIVSGAPSYASPSLLLSKPINEPGPCMGCAYEQQIPRSAERPIHTCSARTWERALSDRPLPDPECYNRPMHKLLWRESKIGDSLECPICTKELEVVPCPQCYSADKVSRKVKDIDDGNHRYFCAGEDCKKNFSLNEVKEKYKKVYYCSACGLVPMTKSRENGGRCSACSEAARVPTLGNQSNFLAPNRAPGVNPSKISPVCVRCHARPCTIELNLCNVCGKLPAASLAQHPVDRLAKPRKRTEPRKRTKPVTVFTCCICLAPSYAAIPPESRSGSAFAAAFDKESFTKKYYLCESDKKGLERYRFSFSGGHSKPWITEQIFLEWVRSSPKNIGGVDGDPAYPEHHQR